MTRAELNFFEMTKSHEPSIESYTRPRDRTEGGVWHIAHWHLGMTNPGLVALIRLYAVQPRVRSPNVNKIVPIKIERKTRAPPNWVRVRVRVRVRASS